MTDTPLCSQSDTDLAVAAPKQPGRGVDGACGRSNAVYLPLNLITNLAYFCINFLISLWFTPYLIRNLGLAVYGLVPLALSVASYARILTDGISASVGRFLTIDLVREDSPAGNCTFNTSLFGALGLVMALFPVCALFSYAAPTLFDVPVGYEQGARWLFLGALSALLVTAVSSVFAVSSFSQNRLYVQHVISIARLVARSAVVVGLFAAFGPHVSHVAMGLVLASVVAWGAHYGVWRRLTPALRVSPGEFHRGRLGELLGMSWWVIVNQVGTVLFLNIDLVVVNVLFGSEMTGRYGAALQFPLLVRALATAISAVLTPIVMARYAVGDFGGLAAVSKQAVRLMSIGMALPIGLLCGLSGRILAAWLGPEFGDLSPLLIVMLGHLAINLSVMPLFALNQAYNRVRVPGLVTLVMGVANVALAVVLGKWGPWGMMGVAIAGAIVLTAKNVLFTPSYVAHIQGLRLSTYYPSIGLSLLGTLGVAIVSHCIASVLNVESLLQIVLVGVAIGVVFGLLTFQFVLSKRDRRLVVTFGTVLLHGRAAS